MEGREKDEIECLGRNIRGGDKVLLINVETIFFSFFSSSFNHKIILVVDDENNMKKERQTYGFILEKEAGEY